MRAPVDYLHQQQHRRFPFFLQTIEQQVKPSNSCVSRTWAAERTARHPQFIIFFLAYFGSSLKFSVGLRMDDVHVLSKRSKLFRIHKSSTFSSGPSRTDETYPACNSPAPKTDATLTPLQTVRRNRCPNLVPTKQRPRPKPRQRTAPWFAS